MFLSIATTRPGARDLGFLLHKHPDRLYTAETSRGKVIGFFPEATEARTEFVLLCEVDPVERVRGMSWDAGIAQYVEPQPFLAASYLSQAISTALRSALNGVAGTKRDPDEDAALKRLATEEWPLEIKVGPVRTSADLAENLFEPLGWDVAVESHALDVPGLPSEKSDLHVLTLSGRATVKAALSALYVLLPVLDPRKHYFYDASEVTKLMDKASDWLTTHPLRELIVRRYLSKSGDLRETAIGLLEPQVSADRPMPEEAMEWEGDYVSPHDDRHARIVGLVEEFGSARVLDLGCGDGKLLARLAKSAVPREIVGMEPSRRDLDRARKRLSSNPAKVMDPRVSLLHGSLTYADERLRGFDVAILSEVIEHIDPERLSLVERAVFGAMRPGKVILTTPNRTYNNLFTIKDGNFRHPDHRFEWTVPECQAWAARVASAYGYTETVEGIGPHDEEHGHLSHLVIFKKASA